MLLHDINDVIMECAKMASYSRAKDLSTLLLVLFVLCWAALRLTAFPFMVIRSTLTELPAVLGGKPPMYYWFNGGLLLLLCLHVYWFALIMRVAKHALSTGEGKDLREEDDSDDDS